MGLSLWKAQQDCGLTLTTLRPPHFSIEPVCGSVPFFSQPEDLYAQPSGGHNSKGSGYKAPLTRVVATPCYRCAGSNHQGRGLLRSLQGIMAA